MNNTNSKSFVEIMEQIEVGDEVNVIVCGIKCPGKIISKLYSKHNGGSNYLGIYFSDLPYNLSSDILSSKDLVSFPKYYEYEFIANINEFCGNKIHWMSYFARATIEKINE